MRNMQFWKFHCLSALIFKASLMFSCHVSLSSLLTVCMLGNFFIIFLSSADFFKINLFWKILSGLPSLECHTVWHSIKPDPEIIKHFHAQLNRARNFNCSWKLKYQKVMKFLALSLSDVVFYHAHIYIVKMPTMVTVKFVLSWVEHEKKFYNLWVGTPLTLNY